MDPAPTLTAKGRATRARIVAAAAELVERQGVAGTGLDEVRRAAGVSGSQLSHYFGDKRSLVRAVVAHQAEAVIGPQEPTFDDGCSLAALRVWADALVARHEGRGCERGCQYGSLAGELAESGDETRAELAAGFLRWQGLIAAGLTRMQDRGELQPDADPAALANALLAALQGGILLTQTLRDPAPLRDSLDAALAHVASFAT